MTRNKTTCGDHLLENGVHRIRISSNKVSTTNVLVELMAHEMCHVKCDRDGVIAEHGADFLAAARTVCRIHGWDPASFKGLK